MHFRNNTDIPCKYISDALFFLATNYVKVLTTTPTSFTKERQT